MYEDTPLTIILSGVDDDGDNLTFTASISFSIPTHLEAVELTVDNIDEFESHLTMTPSLNYSGVVGITVTVDDNQGEENSTNSTQFILQNLAINDAPILTLISVYAIKMKLSILETSLLLVGKMFAQSLIHI